MKTVGQNDREVSRLGAVIKAKDCRFISIDGLAEQITHLQAEKLVEDNGLHFCLTRTLTLNISPFVSGIQDNI